MYAYSVTVRMEAAAMFGPGEEVVVEVREVAGLVTGQQAGFTGELRVEPGGRTTVTGVVRLEPLP